MENSRIIDEAKEWETVEESDTSRGTEKKDAPDSYPGLVGGIQEEMMNSDIGKIFFMLEELGAADLQLKIPRVIICGSENVGKSSLIERIAMLQLFPRDDQITTRIPIELKIRRINEKGLKEMFDKAEMSSQYKPNLKLIRLHYAQGGLESWVAVDASGGGKDLSSFVKQSQEYVRNEVKKEIEQSNARKSEPVKTNLSDGGSHVFSFGSFGSPTATAERKASRRNEVKKEIAQSNARKSEPVRTNLSDGGSHVFSFGSFGSPTATAERKASRFQSTSSSTSRFGSSAKVSDGFSFSGPVPPQDTTGYGVNNGTGKPPYSPMTDRDGIYHSITAQLIYQNWSFDELRMKDYENRRADGSDKSKSSKQTDNVSLTVLPESVELPSVLQGPLVVEAWSTSGVSLDIIDLPGVYNASRIGESKGMHEVSREITVSYLKNRYAIPVVVVPATMQSIVSDAVLGLVQEYGHEKNTVCALTFADKVIDSKKLVARAKGIAQDCPPEMRFVTVVNRDTESKDQVDLSVADFSEREWFEKEAPELLTSGNAGRSALLAHILERVKTVLKRDWLAPTIEHLKGERKKAQDSVSLQNLRLKTYRSPDGKICKSEMQALLKVMRTTLEQLVSSEKFAEIISKSILKENGGFMIEKIVRMQEFKMETVVGTLEDALFESFNNVLPHSLRAFIAAWKNSIGDKIDLSQRKLLHFSWNLELDHIRGYTLTDPAILMRKIVQSCIRSWVNFSGDHDITKFLERDMDEIEDDVSRSKGVIRSIDEAFKLIADAFPGTTTPDPIEYPDYVFGDGRMSRKLF